MNPLSRFWTKARPHLPAFSLALAMFVMGFNTSVMVRHFDRPQDSFAKLKGITEQCIAGWKDANATIQQVRAGK